MTSLQEPNPASEQKLYGLDHLRALAIGSVFLFHYQIPVFGHPAWLPAFIKFGWTGVDLFFVLSGFLISSQLFAQIRQGKNISFKTFFLKRFFRIIPAFWVVVAIYFCFPFFHEREHLSPSWKMLTFTQNIGLNIRDSGTFSHAWSLCVEEHFYFLLPITLIFLLSAHLFKKGYWLLIALFITGFVIRNYTWTNIYLPNIDTENGGVYWYEYIYYPTYCRLDGLLAGVSIACLYQFAPGTWRRMARYGNLLIVLGVVVLTGAYYLCYDEYAYYASVFGFPVVAIGYGLVVSGAISPTSFLYKWHSKATTFIAVLSYSIYLTHKGVIHMTQKAFAGMGMDTSSNLMLVICVISCILGAFVLHIAIEKPFMKLRKRIS